MRIPEHLKHSLKERLDYRPHVRDIQYSYVGFIEYETIPSCSCSSWLPHHLHGEVATARQQNYAGPNRDF